MKTRLVIFTLILIAIFIWIVRPHNQTGDKLERKPQLVQPATLLSTNQVVSLQNSGYQNPTTEEFQKMKPDIEKRRKAMAENADNEWRTPIEFYGRVVDESNNMVAGAMVDYSCNDDSSTGTSYYHTTSDSNGSFSFAGIHGKLLEVHLSKKGYYSYDPHGQFFNYSGENHNFIPDAGNPVIFRMRRMGEAAERIKNDFPSFAHIAQLKHDGTPLILNLYTGQQALGNSGQLKLEYWRDLKEKNPRLFNWQLHITMAGGGLIGTGDEFPFSAPDNGYQPIQGFDMQTNTPDWQNGVNTNYYFQLPDGKYGRMFFEFIPWNGVFTIHSLINPSGSRNLEPK